MTRYYKAVRPDGTDFHSGAINYAAALGGGPIALPRVADPRCCTPDVLHASDVATETLVGGSWPCRLFLVEGEPVAQKGHKWGFFSLTVVEEIDARLALGPNADAVIGLIDRAANLTVAEAEKLATVRRPAWGAAAVTAGGAARRASRLAALDAAWDAAGDAARRAALASTQVPAQVASRGSAEAAAQAAAVRDLIIDEHYQLLVGPWESVMGTIFPEDE